ncbi:MAG: DNA methylase, partial [Candidatus Caldatribacterium sp.]|nr:DNA methylase [Candidatus Caldatribacterium sp.]
LFGMTLFGDLFNSRQKLALITFAEKVRKVYTQMTEQGADPEFAKAVVTYLAIIFNRLTDKIANLVVYNVIGEKIEHVFGRQALPMVWDYIEVNPFTDVGWLNMQEWVELVLIHLTCIPPVEEET